MSRELRKKEKGDFIYEKTTAKAANSKNPDTFIETEEASTEEQPSILPQNDKSPSTHV